VEIVGLMLYTEGQFLGKNKVTHSFQSFVVLTLQSIKEFILFCIRFVFMNNTKNMSKGITFFCGIYIHVKLGSVNELFPTCKNYSFIILISLRTIHHVV